MKRIALHRNKRRSRQQLVRTALRYWEQGRGWDAVLRLQLRGSPETLALAQSLARSPNWRKRCLGLRIAAQLRQHAPGDPGSSTEYALPETQALLLKGLQDTRVEVIRDAAAGVGHRPHPDALMELVRLAAHPIAAVRWSVAMALGCYKEPAATAALMRLAKDTDSAVRDWSTFGLGSLQNADSPEIRDLLWANLQDTDNDVRGQALVGLAERRDPRLTAYLLERLGPSCGTYELEAAEKLASPEMVEPLQKMLEATAREPAHDYWQRCLDAALAACAGRPVA